MGTYDDIQFYTADLSEFIGTYDDIHFIQLILECLWEHMTTYILCN